MIFYHYVRVGDKIECVPLTRKLTPEQLERIFDKPVELLTVGEWDGVSMAIEEEA